ncbi:hypothetical protein GCM10023095_07950 [Pseudaeromonas paramecii]|uniref:Uncharacterized protein n=1 Tax=Pseudaeromonas paramecii TaxID=2138166 RepID=A0ABP8Q0D9_9GAMM
MGIVKSGHEPYPVIYLGDDLYIKFFTYHDKPISDKGKVCKYGNSRYEIWLWSKHNVTFNVSDSYFVRQNGDISHIVKIGRWYKYATEPRYDINQEHVNIDAGPRVSSELISLWKENKITELMDTVARRSFEIDIEPTTGCPTEKFKAVLSFTNELGVQKNHTIYFFPFYFDYYLLH